MLVLVIMRQARLCHHSTQVLRRGCEDHERFGTALTPSCTVNANAIERFDGNSFRSPDAFHDI